MITARLRLDVPAGLADVRAFYAFIGDTRLDSDAVIGCMSENLGAPIVRDVYFRVESRPNHYGTGDERGVVVHVRFDGSFDTDGCVVLNITLAGSGAVSEVPTPY